MEEVTYSNFPFLDLGHCLSASEQNEFEIEEKNHKLSKEFSEVIRRPWQKTVVQEKSSGMGRQ